MTGLDKILQQIQQEALAAAQQNLNQAKREAEQILADARTEAEKQRTHILEQAEAAVNDVTARGVSAAQLEKRRRMLSAKQQLIGKIIDEAQASLYRLPDEEYFSLLLQMVKKYALPGQTGLLVLNERDLRRCPQAFMQRVNQQLDGGSLELSSQLGQLKGGFLLVYGGIEENCSFEALFDAAREQLQDKVRQTLFAS